MRRGEDKHGPETRRLLALILWVSVLFGCSGSGDMEELRGTTMGTTYSVKLARLPRGIDREELFAEIDAALARVDATMSTYRENSELSRFNASRSTDRFEVSADVARVAAAAGRSPEETAGAFDPTVGPLVNLWGFGPGPGAVSLPTEAQIAQAKDRVGFGNLRVTQEPPALRKARPDLYLDLSAIAKGYGADRVAGVLDSRGVEETPGFSPLRLCQKCLVHLDQRPKSRIQPG